MTSHVPKSGTAGTATPVGRITPHARRLARLLAARAALRAAQAGSLSLAEALSALSRLEGGAR